METTDDEEVYVNVICEETVRYDQIILMKKSEYERIKNMLGSDILAQLKAQRRIRDHIDNLVVDQRDHFYINKFEIEEEK